MITAYLTRFADMAHVLSRWHRGSRWSWTGLFGGLAVLLLIAPSPARAQRAATKESPPAKADQPKAAPAAEADQDAPAAAPDVNPPADPSQTRRVAPVEVFKDPDVEAILEIASLRPLAGAPNITQNEILQVKEQAGNPNMSPNRALIDRVVRGLAAKLTDRKSIESLLEESKDEAPKETVAKATAPKAAPRRRPEGDGGKVIQEATDNLLEPIYMAQAAKNDGFLKEYRLALNTHLPQLLKNHLIPRLQAMIVLGEAASPEALTIFQNEIGSRSQVLWVKLWALQGITNIKRGGGRFTADVESRASRAVADFLERQKDLPWPIQLRGLEALGSLRQGALPTDPSRAHMANAAMAFLADSDAKTEVRSEAARALGLMQVNAVPNYNFRLIAHAAGQLAADLATEINNQYTDSPPRAENPTRARYLTALLVGPVYQAFEGVQGESGSGLLQIASRDQQSLKYIRQVFDQVRQLSQASVDLIGAPSKDYKARKQALAARTAALRGFLQQNPPPNRRLVNGGRQFGNEGNAAGAWAPAPAQPVAQVRRGR
jgi:hypothetical protein